MSIVDIWGDKRKEKNVDLNIKLWIPFSNIFLCIRAGLKVPAEPSDIKSPGISELYLHSGLDMSI